MCCRCQKKLWLYGEEVSGNGNSEQEFVSFLSGSHNFHNRFRKMKQRERFLELGGSKGVTQCLNGHIQYRVRNSGNSGNSVNSVNSVNSAYAPHRRPLSKNPLEKCLEATPPWSLLPVGRICVVVVPNQNFVSLALCQLTILLKNALLGGLLFSHRLMHVAWE